MCTAPEAEDDVKLSSPEIHENHSIGGDSASTQYSMGIRAIYGLPLPLISSRCSFYFFFTCVDFIIYCWTLINLI